MMKLLYTKRSPYARKARILAVEKGIELDLIDEDLTNKSQQLLVSNPVGKIPTLILDDGTCLCDSPLICEYLDDLVPQPRFVPTEPRQRLAVLNLAAIADGMMDITVSAYMEKVRHPQDFAVKFVEAQYSAIERLLGYFELHIDEIKNWNLGSVGVLSSLGYLNFRLGELYRKEKYPNLDRWYQELSARPGVKETAPVA